MRTGLYGQLARTEAIAPEDTDTVGQTYTDMAVAGHCTEAQRTLFFEAAQELTDKGAEAVILAGTDLNLAFDARGTPYRVIDALDVHVEVLAKLATGKLSLE